MRVLTILHSLSIGGIEKTLYHCLPELNKGGIDITICCFERGGNLEKEFISRGVEVLYIKKTGSLFLDFIQLISLLTRHDFDIIHSRLSYTSGGFALASKFLNKPFLLSIHNEFPATLIKWANKPVFSSFRKIYLKMHKYLSTKFSTRIIGHSKSNLESNFNDWESSSKFIVLYNGVEFNVLDEGLIDGSNQDILYNNAINKKKSKDAFNIVHIGTFKEQKNHIFMLNCFKRLEPIENNYHLILLGDGELRKRIEDKILELGIENNVHLVGFSKEISKWLLSSDLFFFPSTFEGFANVLIEAQYLKLPVCASGINSHFESVHTTYHKYFFNPTNESECLNKLQEIILDIKLGKIEKDLSNIKDNMLNNFSIDRMALNLSKIYKSIKNISIQN